MVPPGIPGRSDESFLPAFDPAAARRLLAEAGYADPATFPDVTLVTAGAGYDEAILAQLRENLGITVRFEALDFGTLFARLGSAGLAGPVGPLVDRRLPVAERLPGDPARDRPAEQLRGLVERRVRRRDRVGGRDRRSGGGARRLRRGRVDPRATRCRRSR